MKLRSIWQRLCRPLDHRRVRALAARLADYPDAETGPDQAVGRYAVGCGATYGVHEACNFGCTACYLSKAANHQPPAPFAEVRRQLTALAAYLGPGGNVQITSGEVTLLPAGDLVRIIAEARRLGMSPMVMTHGDVLLHDATYLDRLVIEGGLRKLSLHIDTTQRGRKGVRIPESEAALHGVREQACAMLRACRARTGVKLKTAMTLTVNSRNLEELGEVLTWTVAHLDCFRIISLQPQAAIGRSRREPHGVSADDVWQRLESTLGMKLNPHAFRFGHRACNRVALVLAVETRRDRHLVQAVRPDNAMDAACRDRFLRDFGGIDINDRTAGEVAATLLGMLLRKPAWLWHATLYALRRSFQERRLVPTCLAALVTGRLRLRPLGIVVHAFMSPEELTTEEGRARLEACTFKLAGPNGMVSMCAMNAGAEREAGYLRAEAVGASV